MSSSILTNTSAMAALATLRSINQQLDTTQNRISSGLKVATASDNAAYWSIATTMKSDNQALSSVSDALALGSSTIDVAYTGMNSVIDNLNAIKKDLVTAQQPGVDKSKLQDDIASKVATIQSIATTATFAGSNWLSINSDNGDTMQSVVASLTRDSSGAISLGTIDVDTTKTALFDAGAAKGLLEDSATSGTVTSATFAWNKGTTNAMDDGGTLAVALTVDGTAQTVNVTVTDADSFSLSDLVSGLNAGLSGATATADSGKLLLTSNTTGASSSVAITGITAKLADGTTTSDATTAIVAATGTAGADTGGGGLADIDISDADQATVKNYMTAVDSWISTITSAASTLGAKKTQISDQSDFLSSLMDSIDTGVGRLVDADMNAESTRLKALQTQQQLGIQALSIANSNSQSILQLFR